jgi:predicted metalloprotease with PDZ domain
VEAEEGVGTARTGCSSTSSTAPGRSPAPDLNEFAAGAEPNFGVRANGMRITAVMAGTNAEAIGFKPGDLVVSINGGVCRRRSTSWSS